MNDILEEVISDKNYERKVIIFKKILPIIIGITIFFALIMLIIGWYADKKIQNNINIGDKFVNVLINDIKYNNDSKENINIISRKLDDIINSSENSKILELIQIKKALLYLENKETTSSLRVLDEVINNNSYSNLTKAYARILWISIFIDNNTSKTSSNEDLHKLESYVVSFSKSEPFFQSANMLKALWHIENKEYSLAKKHANLVFNKQEASYIMQEQAKALMSNIQARDNE